MITPPESWNDLKPFALSGALEEPPAAAYHRVRDAIQREPAPAPRASLAVTALWLALGTLLALDLDALWRMRTLVRADLQGMLGGCLASVAVGALVALGASQLVLSKGRSGLGPSVQVLRAIAFGVPILNLVPQLFLLATAARQPELPRVDVHAFGAPCFLLSIVIAGMFLALFARHLRGSVVAAAGWRSAALGAAAGAWSGLALIVHCPGVDAVHLLIGHGLPALLFPLVGLAFVRRHVQV